MSPRRIQWTLTQPAFDRLLDSLDVDRGRAGEAYQHLRSALVKFFESRAGLNAEDAADDVLNRIARRLDEGEPIADVRSYAYGVARRLLLEAGRNRSDNVADLEAAAPDLPVAEQQREEPLDCLDECVGALAADDRQLILDYHQDEGGGRVKRRLALAERLRIPVNALRIRAHRIRLRLEECVTGCVRRKKSS